MSNQYSNEYHLNTETYELEPPMSLVKKNLQSNVTQLQQENTALKRSLYDVKDAWKECNQDIVNLKCILLILSVFSALGWVLFLTNYFFS